jgi:hypothetical protein
MTSAIGIGDSRPKFHHTRISGRRTSKRALNSTTAESSTQLPKTALSLQRSLNWNERMSPSAALLVVSRSYGSILSNLGVVDAASQTAKIFAGHSKRDPLGNAQLQIKVMREGFSFASDFEQRPPSSHGSFRGKTFFGFRRISPAAQFMAVRQALGLPGHL